MCQWAKPEAWIYKLTKVPDRDDEPKEWSIFRAYRNSENPNLISEECLESHGLAVGWDAHLYPPGGILSLLYSEETISDYEIEIIQCGVD